MDNATNSTGSPARKPFNFADLAGRISDLVHMTRIADDFAERTLAYEHGEEVVSGYYRFLLSDHELGDLSFLLGEAQHRARLLSEAFYAGMEASR
jgi:hypothetical protein